jgi:Domain of unknown function (DUF397)
MVAPEVHTGVMSYGQGRMSFRVSAEIADARWFKSSQSAYNGNCVEVARLSSGRVAVRDSKAGPEGSVLLFSQAEWRSLLRSVRG